MYPTLTSSIISSKTPSLCVELRWRDGIHLMALPVILLASSNWEKRSTHEQVECEWGLWTVIFTGYGLQSLPGSLIRGEISAITELPEEQSEVVQGSVITQIWTQLKKTETAKTPDA